MQFVSNFQPKPMFFEIALLRKWLYYDVIQCIGNTKHIVTNIFTPFGKRK